ncbi:hypothetical protein BMF94_4727 [Rhodotorula taiwanensis]|uniref:Uncharacterized protein n=1 Tax=Rhodotorula taiwanensis TaxID=741276 RepID=A0A2S5B683_9BASI|nr:hypothetical protein BMF94_4727 [Rhodotorula taiwanensis]
MSNPSTVAVFPFDRLPDELIEAIARWVIAADWDYARDRVRSHRRYCSIMTCIIHHYPPARREERARSKRDWRHAQSTRREIRTLRVVSEDSYEADERIERLANCIAGEVEDLHCSFQCWSGCSRPDLSYALVEDLIQRMSCLRRLTVKVDRDWPQDERKDDEGADEVDDDLAAYRSLLQYAKARQLERLEVQGAKAWLTTSQDRRA